MNILDPRKEITVGKEAVTVSELNWKDGTAFLQRLAISVASVMNEQGDFTPTAGAVAALVARSTELTEDLITKATGKSAEWLAERTMAEVIELLDSALELNLNPELIAKGKNLAGRVRGAFGLTSTLQ